MSNNIKLDTLTAGSQKLRSGGVDFDVTAHSKGEVEAVSARTGDYMYANFDGRLFAMAKDLDNNGLDAGDSVIYSWGDPHFNEVTITGNEGSMSLKDIVQFYGHVTDFDVQSNYILNTKTARALVDTQVVSENYTVNDKITWEVAGENGVKGALSFDFNDQGGIDMGVGQLVTRASLAADPTGDATVELLYDPSKSAMVYLKDENAGKILAVGEGTFIDRKGVDTANKLIAPVFGGFVEANGLYFGDGNNEGSIADMEKVWRAQLKAQEQRDAQESLDIRLEAPTLSQETNDDDDEEAIEQAFQLTLDVTAKVKVSG